jgi:transposase
MLSITSQKIYLFKNPVNLHMSFEGLSCLAQSYFPDTLFKGSLIIFLNRQKNKIKALYWDNDGLAIWYKRLEKGRFRIDKEGKTQLTRREFLMLLEGIKPRRINVRFSLEKS